MVSFPPLIDMLKFSGYPHLIRGQLVGRFTARPPPRVRCEVLCELLRRGGRGGVATAFRGRRAAVPQHRAGLEGGNDARTGMPARVLAGAMCVQRFDGSLNSAIHITYRISLRSSSMPEPRDPLLKVLMRLLACTPRFARQRVWGLRRTVRARWHRGGTPRQRACVHRGLESGTR